MNLPEQYKYNKGYIAGLKACYQTVFNSLVISPLSPYTLKDFTWWFDTSEWDIFEDVTGLYTSLRTRV